MGRLAVSNRRHWEGSLMCDRSVMPAYPHISQGEDTVLVEKLLSTVRVARADLPRLYIYIVHGANTFSPQHFQAIWEASEFRLDGDDARIALSEIARRVPINGWLRAL